VKKRKAEVEKKIQIEQAISSMVAKYNAVTDWKKNFNNESVLLGKIYTVQVEDALIRSDNRPILFFAFVEDVQRQGNKYYVHFWNWYELGPDIRFVLECNSKQAKKILEQKTDFFEKYAVVALISTLQKPKFEVKAYPHSRGGADIIVEPSDIFIAKGRCLDLLFVGDYEERKEE